MKEEIRYIKTNILKPYNVAISLRSDTVNEGDMSDSSPENSANRAAMFNALEITGRKIIHNKQIHSDIIIDADNNDTGEADGIITSSDCTAPYILTADCFNVFFKTDADRKFGVVHAGWKGILGGIIESLNDILEGESEVLIAQGICMEHFEVDFDVMKDFRERFGDRYIEMRKDKFHIDLRNIISDILSDKAQIHNLRLCNVCMNDILFSYRNSDIKRRNMSIIWR